MSKIRSNHGQALYMLDANDLTFLWANAEYLALPFVAERGPDIIGRALTDVSPFIGATRLAVFRRVAETGQAETGSDFIVDVGRSPVTHHWTVYRPLPNVILVSIVTERNSSSG